MRILVLAVIIGAVSANDWSTLRDRCDRNDDKDLSSTEFDCLFMQFDKNYDNFVDESEFESGWRHYGIDYTYRTPVFFMESDINGDYKIDSSDMAYLMTIWDVDGNREVSEKELEAGWRAFYYDRFHS